MYRPSTTRSTSYTKRTAHPITGRKRQKETSTTTLIIEILGKFYLIILNGYFLIKEGERCEIEIMNLCTLKKV